MADKSSRSNIIEFFYKPNGPSEGECGYCDKHKDVSYGVWGHQIDCALYSELYLRGWSRVGKYLFKSVNEKTCCPQYAISCDASTYILSKSQKKVLTKFWRYLETGSVKAVNEKKNAGQDECLVAKEQTLVDGNGDVASEVPVDPETDTDSTNRPPSQRGVVLEKRGTGSAKKTVSDFITVDAPMVGQTHRLDVSLVKLPYSQELRWIVKESYELYRSYRAVVHSKKESDEECFKARCLDSPFVPFFGHSETGLDCGTYHCHYYLDGKLFMVGVVDLVPACFISVYLFYNPDYRFLSPGVFSALYEIALVQHMSLLCTPPLQHYCLDQYVHTTQKMNYKRHFAPSYLLCTRALTWHPIGECVAKLEKNRCSYFSATGDNESTDSPAISKYQGSLDDIPIVLITGPKGASVTHRIEYRFLHVLLGGERDKVDAMVREYVNIVGRSVASQAYLVISSNTLQKLISPAPQLTSPGDSN